MTTLLELLDAVTGLAMEYLSITISISVFPSGMESGTAQELGYSGNDELDPNH